MLVGVYAYPNLNGQRVNDFANILTPTEIADLTTQINSMEQSTGAQFAIFTTLNTEGDNRVNYAARTGEQNGVGVAGKDNGVVIMWSLDNEAGGAIATGRGIGDILTDVEVSSIGRSHRNELDNGQYYIALSGILTDIQKQFPSNETRECVIDGSCTSGVNGVSQLPIGVIILIVVGAFILLLIVVAALDEGSSGGSGGFAGGYVGSSGGWSSGSSGGGFSGGSFGGGGGGF